MDIGINQSYNGTAPHSSASPWVDVLFQDIAKNTVQLTITAPYLTNPEFLQNLFLNFNTTKRIFEEFSGWGMKERGKAFR